MSKNFELLRQIEEEGFRAARGTWTTSNSTTALRPSVPSDASTPRMSPRLAAEVSRFVQQIFLLPGAAAPRVVIFAAAERAPEPDWVSARAAEVLASQSHTSVCLVDMDYFVPSVHRYFAISNTKGFTDSLADSVPAVEFAHRVPGLDLLVIPSGKARTEPEQTGAFERAMQRIGELRAQFDFVLVNAPPLRGPGHTLLAGRLSDGIVMIVEAHTTRREMALIAKQELNRANVRLLGAVLNNRTFPIPEGLYSRL